MGEARRRKNSAGIEHAELDRRLRDVGIDTSQFGFYDQPAFLTQEARDPAFLETYAVWVQTRPFSPDYAQRVRSVVPRLAEVLAGLFEANDMQRSCVAASSMMPPILDRLGIWSFGLKGSLTMEVPARHIWRCQALIDVADFPGAELGHAWVAAPPFRIVDPTIGLQNPPGDAICGYIPPFVAVEDDARVVKPSVTDVVGAEIRAHHALMEGRQDPQLHHRLNPSLRNFSRSFPALETTVGELTLRYVPAGVRLSDVTLEQINSGGDRGLSGREVWEIVRTEFADFEV
jgi:hypothetical protein